MTDRLKQFVGADALIGPPAIPPACRSSGVPAGEELAPPANPARQRKKK